MKKIRLYELAKELGVSARDLSNALKELGHDVRTNFSPLDATAYNDALRLVREGNFKRSNPAEATQRKCQTFANERSNGYDPPHWLRLATQGLTARVQQGLKPKLSPERYTLTIGKLPPTGLTQEQARYLLATADTEILTYYAVPGHIGLDVLSPWGQIGLRLLLDGLIIDGKRIEVSVVPAAKNEVQKAAAKASSSAERASTGPQAPKRRKGASGSSRKRGSFGGTTIGNKRGGLGGSSGLWE